MRQWLQNLSDTLVDRLVPKAEAAAATECWTETVCVRNTGTAFCGYSGNMATFTYLVCPDGTRTFKGMRCGC
ncbi:hypothetical protein [Kitasatospora herbaricolor]|uniref:Uncharacterized protein n=1 Tax=Kitasatospora herbaricolor TaxID=68217 RepID=A0ABZ1W065_9ACTN|nr:hypothetical protein [Kitasatospora herbaricolor]